MSNESANERSPLIPRDSEDDRESRKVRDISVHWGCLSLLYSCLELHLERRLPVHCKS